MRRGTGLLDLGGCGAKKGCGGGRAEGEGPGVRDPGRGGGE